jgi:spore maturation protein CgeB
MFEPGKEIVAYRLAEECVEMVQYYLEHDKEREALARAGQQRTLWDHTYY